MPTPMPTATPAQMHDKARNNERGSVMLYIFIAIAALAALTFAVTRGSRESVSTVDREKSDLNATQILDYTGMIRRSIQTMKVDGIADLEICFDSDQWSHNSYEHSACSTVKNQVFSINGGGATFQKPNPALLDTKFTTQPGWGDWHFTGANIVTGVGSDEATDSEGNDLLLVLPFIRQDACLALNKRLQISSSTTIPTGNLNTTAYFANGFPSGETLNAAALKGKRSGCFKAITTPASDAYVFYAVLVSR